MHGVEVINASRSELENFMAKQYAVNYKFLEIAGSDNHCGNRQKLIAGICTDTPLADEMDFIERVKNGQTETFVMENPILP